LKRRGRAISVRDVAARVVDRVLATYEPTDLLLASAGARFEERDRRLLQELVYGVLRWLRRLDHVISIAAERELDAIEPRVATALRVGALQLLALDRVPAHAAVAEAVDSARRGGGRGAAGFVNAVLRRVARSPDFASFPVEDPDPVRRLAIETSHPDEMVRRWWDRFGEARARAISEADDAPPRLHLLAFADRGGRDSLAAALAAEGTETEPSRRSPVGLVVRRGRALGTDAFARGDFYVQDASSQAAALVPAPRAGERILDAAAAPGGKGFALLAVEPAARVVCADRSLARLRRLDENLRRLGRAAPRVVADAARPVWRAAFDRVVLDAACSGTGTLCRHPELRWRFDARGLERLAAASLEQLEGLAPAVASGGLLAFVTCSIEAEENEEVGVTFLARHPEFAAAPFDSAEVPPYDDGDPGAGWWRVFPGPDGDGFSVQLFRRER